MSEFNNYHPLSSFVYFTIVVIFCMLFSHPILILISLLSAIVYSIMLNGRRALLLALFGVVPTILLSLVINSAFNHAGVTIIAYFPNGNPLTLESIIYGGVSGARIASVIFWFMCFNKLITSDKLVYLFGKITPSLSLVLSMTLRFVPRFRNQLRRILNANRSLGIYNSNNRISARFRGGVRSLSTLIGIALEDSIETADSMKRRGYGTTKRSAYSVFEFEARDAFFFAIMILLSIMMLYGYCVGTIDAKYFPSIRIDYYGGVLFYIAYIALCCLPIIIDVLEGLKWKALKSKI